MSTQNFGVKAQQCTRPFYIEDGVGLIVDDVDEHVSLSIIHSAFLIHVELDNMRVRQKCQTSIERKEKYEKVKKTLS